jgi:glycine dehydrogenase
MTNAPARTFAARHNGPRADDIAAMITTIGVSSLDRLIDDTVPERIRLRRPLDLPAATDEHTTLLELQRIAGHNRVTKSFIGMGYSDCITPGVILRNIMENPGWYTAYTPYQAEIAQGRLEALLNFQTMVCDLTGMEMCGASLLDEGTAAAEAMTMCLRVKGDGAPKKIIVDAGCFPQTIAVVQQRAEPLGIEVVIGDASLLSAAGSCAVLVQNPTHEGKLIDLSPIATKAHAAGAMMIAATDVLALTLMTSPGEQGADVVVGTTQRFGVPMGYGGPHAAFLATKSTFARSMPGRLIGVSEDANGQPALRMALQTREQHIRREKATSNVCTAQVLLAVMASMYAVYHGPEGLRAIATEVHHQARRLASSLRGKGVRVRHEAFFDTVVIDSGAQTTALWEAARKQDMTLRRFPDGNTLGISVDETTTAADIEALVAIISAGATGAPASLPAWPSWAVRATPYLTHPVFHRHRSETEMVRYIKELESKDYSLVHGMIPLGSCTMKLNATAEMTPVTWPAFGKLHPFAPLEDARGYAKIFKDLEHWLGEITGFDAMSLQPNAGSQGEYAGMLVIRAYHQARGEGHRDVVLIPSSAHGTNPASAVMAGLRVVVTKCDEDGNVDVADLKARIAEHKNNLAALMVTYPSTHGVFEAAIVDICAMVHDAGGQVYMDGANMNAQVGLCRPGDIGADVCHLNLHKTFCIPHGGGGPGMGPIGVKKHLAPFLSGHPCVEGVGGSQAIGPISAAPWGSASILLISWSYIRMMGPDLAEATKLAILTANYVAKRLQQHYPVLYAGQGGFVAHECILELRHLKASAGIEAEDVAKRLMDYGFHAPTLSFPVAGTLMVEPTESEPKAELDRFCEAMIAIRHEIAAIESGAQPREGNVLKHAPHTMGVVCATAWTRPYPREQAAFPTAHQRRSKFWPTVGRLNAVLGDRKLICTCPPISDYT